MLSPYGSAANAQMAHNALLNREVMVAHATAGAALEHRTLLGNPTTMTLNLTHNMSNINMTHIMYNNMIHNMTDSITS